MHAYNCACNLCFLLCLTLTIIIISTHVLHKGVMIFRFFQVLCIFKFALFAYTYVV